MSKAKNYMKDLAQMLGVKLEEEFEINDLKGRFKMTNKGLMICFTSDGNWKKCDGLMLDLLVRGMRRIKKEDK